MEDFFMKKSLISAITILTSVLLLTACSGEKDNATESPKTNEPAKETIATETTADPGETIVMKSCVGCHGNQLQGARGPSLQKIGAEHSKDEIKDIVTNGKGAMPKMLEGEEAEKVAEYLSKKK